MKSKEQKKIREGKKQTLWYDNRKILSHDIKTSSYSIWRQTCHNGFNIDPSTIFPSFSFTQSLYVFISAPLGIHGRKMIFFPSSFSGEKKNHTRTYSQTEFPVQCKFIIAENLKYYVTVWVDPNHFTVTMDGVW